jgi:hypothetical protein
MRAGRLGFTEVCLSPIFSHRPRNSLLIDSYDASHHNLQAILTKLES